MAVDHTLNKDPEIDINEILSRVDWQIAKDNPHERDGKWNVMLIAISLSTWIVVICFLIVGGGFLWIAIRFLSNLGEF